jgi:hypothetical protein
VALAIGGGIYESIVVNPQWKKSPPSSFSILQPGTGVPFQRFWIPVHGAITLFFITSLILTWGNPAVRSLHFFGLVSYIVMRGWSGLYFIPEMLSFQRVPLDSPPSPELTARVSRWASWTWFREPLDINTMSCSLLALYRLKS